ALVGRWGPLISVPLVAAAAATQPRTGKVLLWAADTATIFDAAGEEDSGNTITAVFDPSTGTVISQNLSETRHNMFCPGISLTSDGEIFVTGGKSSRRVSIYKSDAGEWVRGPEMVLGRGYHSHTTCSDGRIFVLGGSWSGGLSGKNGEVFDEGTGVWASLPGCSSTPMLTDDTEGAFASDNHAWLFAWSNGSVFQAGPSSAINWYMLTEHGSTIPAGSRGDDSDAMNGNAVMYDALHGKILTLGGSESYKGCPATNNAHIVTIGDPFTRPLIERLDDMHSARAFANSVVLPSGDVFISGGVTWALQWTDVNASLVPEMWSPRTHRFTNMARSPVPRTYHSFALLLPDATVLTGGGGLCWKRCEDEKVNHKDVQVYLPPNLFDAATGRLARRPVILEVSKTELLPGDHISLYADEPFIDLVLIRYASATHSINTDQRRIKLSRGQPKHQDRTDDRPIESWLYNTHLPQDPGVLLPGYWMLFALNAHGTPSIATTLRIKV
ncbi:putative galactose oxidase precursor, partial [Thozetella sp. PMI_491]